MMASTSARNTTPPCGSSFCLRLLGEHGPHRAVERAPGCPHFSRHAAQIISKSSSSSSSSSSSWVSIADWRYSTHSSIGSTRQKQGSWYFVPHCAHRTSSMTASLLGPKGQPQTGHDTGSFGGSPTRMFSDVIDRRTRSLAIRLFSVHGRQSCGWLLWCERGLSPPVRECMPGYVTVSLSPNSRSDCSTSDPLPHQWFWSGVQLTTAERRGQPDLWNYLTDATRTVGPTSFGRRRC